MRQGLWNKASFRKYTQLDHADRLRDAPFKPLRLALSMRDGHRLGQDSCVLRVPDIHDSRRCDGPLRYQIRELH
jgi:hypothetical protein